MEQRNLQDFPRLESSSMNRFLYEASMLISLSSKPLNILAMMVPDHVTEKRYIEEYQVLIEAYKNVAERAENIVDYLEERVIHFYAELGRIIQATHKEYEE